MLFTPFFVISSFLAASSYAATNTTTVGSPCGGGIRGADCGTGFVCHYRDGHRRGERGLCLPLAKVHGRCGGSIRFPSQCPEGSECQYASQDPDHPRHGAFGTCELVDGDNDNDDNGNDSTGTVSALGGPCGADSGKACGNGLICLDDNNPTNASRPLPGLCLPLARLNEPCGGGVRYPAMCAPNAECTFPDGMIPGRRGVCKEKLFALDEACGGPYFKRCQSGLLCARLSALLTATGKCISRN